MIALFGIMQACEDSLLILIIALFGVFSHVHYCKLASGRQDSSQETEVFFYQFFPVDCLVGYPLHHETLGQIYRRIWFHAPALQYAGTINDT